jgi:hypothetical protein
MDFNQIMQTVTTIAIAFGLKIVGAIVVWVTPGGSNRMARGECMIKKTQKAGIMLNPIEITLLSEIRRNILLLERGPTKVFPSWRGPVRGLPCLAHLIPPLREPQGGEQSRTTVKERTLAG